MIFQYFVWSALTLQYFANLPLIYKIVKTKSAKDLSLFTCYIWAYVTLVMFIYAALIHDMYFMLGQSGQFLVNLIILLLVNKYGNN